VKFIPTELPGVILIEPDVHGDARGFFLETYHEQKYAQAGIRATFVQDNHSRSSRGTLRGLHFQDARPQGKLVRVVEGEVYDVAVDIRRGSPTFAEHVGVLLSASSFRQLYIPPNFAHGFCVTSEVAQFEYKCTDFYDPAGELAVAWDDPDLAIPWPIESPELSARDTGAPRLCELTDRLPVYDPASD
jgi:dTDP-4-dehydrorhamnose 3,5-epimerase